MLPSPRQERPRLLFHLEKKELPVYALVVDRGGPKFQRSKSAGPPSIRSAGPYALRFERISMAELARTLDPPFTSRHVLDETGLAGVYDFTLDLAPYVCTGRGAIDREAAHLQALRRQLGLRLERKTAPLDVMVVDAIDTGAMAS